MEISPQPSTSYVYLLQEREFVKTSENIYKIGRTKKENFTRFNQYPKGSILLFQIICQNDVLVEDLILKQFNLYFTRQPLIGREYFKGDFRIMIDMMHTIVKNKMTPTEMQQLEMEKIEMEQEPVAHELQKKRKLAINTSIDTFFEKTDIPFNYTCFEKNEFALKNMGIAYEKDLKGFVDNGGICGWKLRENEESEMNKTKKPNKMSCPRVMKWRNAHREQYNSYQREFMKANYTDDAKRKKREYYLAKKERKSIQV